MMRWFTFAVVFLSARLYAVEIAAAAPSQHDLQMAALQEHIRAAQAAGDLSALEHWQRLAAWETMQDNAQRQGRLDDERTQWTSAKALGSEATDEDVLGNRIRLDAPVTRVDESGVYFELPMAEICLSNSSSRQRWGRRGRYHSSYRSSSHRSGDRHRWREHYRRYYGGHHRRTDDEPDDADDNGVFWNYDFNGTRNARSPDQAAEQAPRFFTKPPCNSKPWILVFRMNQPADLRLITGDDVQLLAVPIRAQDGALELTQVAFKYVARQKRVLYSASADGQKL